MESWMYWGIAWVVSMVVAFVGGMLVYRNNAKSWKAAADSITTMYEKQVADLKAKLPK